MSLRVLMYSTLFVLAAGIVIGLLIGYSFWHQPVAPSAESVKAQIIQRDSSVVAARVPVAEKNLPKPPHIIPKNTREERRGTIVVTPEPDLVNGCQCEPVTVDWSLVRAEDGRRFVVSSPDGRIDSALDTPILDDAAPSYRNALGVSWRPEPTGDAYGVLYQRDVLGRFRVGAGVEYQPHDGLRANVQAMLRY